ncbi:hypothetical protein GCM10027413_19820 [Conyzicola nivalis]|uniref:Glycosyltransferase n=1 Tax=Conyzicola nivalis TaxID=1477021 RepID=A0A916WGC0_9MICO|nr:hypothetical protein GCM10010979_06800 [Conyzicola nivalis]
MRRYAADLAAAIGGESGPMPETPPARMHAHVTDRIFGSSPEEAADRVEALGASTRLTITLHDVPQQSDGTNLGRRSDAYRRFIGAARGVVVNSRHEAMLLDEHLGRAEADSRVIPLGARARGPADRPRAGGLRPRTVLISGFVYPGKGHLEAIQAAAVAGAPAEAAPATVVAVGAPSAGHERDAHELARRAAELGVDFRVTGFLDDRDYRNELLSDGVPLAAHQHVSASRSILDWAELGRRALVIDSRYAREMEALRPGSISVFRPDELAGKLEAAWNDPESTWLPPSTALSPTLDDVAAEYRAWWRDVA